MTRFDWKKAVREGDAGIKRIQDDDTAMETIESIENDLQTLSTLPTNDITEIAINVDQVVEHLSDLWNDSASGCKMSYDTFVRMTVLCDHNILSVVQRIFDSFDLLNIKKSALKQILSFTQSYATGIANICNSNTAQARRWATNPYQSKAMASLEKLTKRFIDVIRVINDISSLLDQEEQDSLHFSSIAASASNLVPTRLLSHPPRLWDAQFRLFEARLSQAERCAASKLHAQMMTASSSPEVVLQAFASHPTLLIRPAAIQELGHELSEAASFILSQIQRISSSIAKRAAESPIDNLVWFQQKKALIEQYIKFTHALPEPESLQESLKSVGNDLKAFGQAQMKRWIANIKSKLPTTLTVPTDDTLIAFDSSSGITVNFSDDLCQFLDDVRRITSAKMTIPKQIQDIVNRATPIYKQALIMQRVANFYNEMPSRILQSQKPMLLKPATEFEALARSARKFDPNTAPQLLSKLQMSLSDIMARNSSLKQEHENITKELLKLADVDLVDKKNVWTQKISEIRLRVQAVAKDYADTNFWTHHLDVQLYKILQYQFRSSLLQLSERSAQIEISLTFTDNKLQFRPVIEDIRHMYYQSVNDLLTYPMKFRGISSESTFFSKISESAPDIVFFVYQKGELLIKQVFDYQFQFKEWIILANNLDTLEEKCKSMITTAAEWKSNISLVSMRKENINKIDDTVVVGCFKIDVTQAKEGFRRLLSQFQSILVQSLRKTLREEFENVQKFVSEGLELMSMKFETSEAIAESRTKFEDLVRSKVEVELTFTSLTEKVNLLKSFESIEQETEEFDKLHKNWKTLTSKMESFDETVASQFENVKNKMREDFVQLKQDLHKFKLRWDEMKPKDLNFDDDSVVVSVPNVISKFKTELGEFKTKYEALAKPLADFDENVQIPEFEELENEINLQEGAIELLVEWRSQFTEMASQKWDVASQKLFLVEDFLNGWSSKLSALEYTSDAALYIDGKVKHYKSIYPFLKYARGDDWCEEHWFSFFKMVGISTSTSYKELQLGDLLEVGDMLQSNMKALKELAERARGEATIRTSLEEIRSWFSTTNFSWFNHTFAGRTTFIVKEWKQLISDLADKQSLISSLKDSPFIKAFQDDAILWDQKAVSLATSLRLLNEIQRKWLHLEPVFVKKSLPAHQEEFEQVDSEFRGIMQKLKDAHRASVAADLSAEQLEKMQTRLDTLNRALNIFLEQKRDKFSRFYFIGDEDLLEIIGQASEDATIIQSHLKKLFQGVATVKFDETNKVIVSVCSSLGEVVKLKKPVKCEGAVEVWLMQLSDQVADTLRLILCDMMKTKNVDYYTFPSQLTLLYHQIKFTELVEENRTNVEKISQFVEENLHKLVSADQNNDLQRYVVRSLIIEYVRFRQVVQELDESSAWKWQKQLRFYFRDNTAFAEMGDAIIPYGFEYQGNPARLVYTPLTAKCYLTLCEGIALGYGGNPYGPAGTGKTESVKALGQALGRQVLVFNCDEAIDVQSMCRIFTGLVMGGAWGCFDEFNRLDEEVLSALSQQIQIIQTAILEKSANVELYGKKVNVNPNAGIYVTLNPAGKGYGGRSKLPSNLVQLFRAVAMSAPDNELIAEVLMYSQGFHQAHEISRQLVLVFSLSRQLLSPEIHYDWGLRALKSILSTAEQWLNTGEGGDIDEASLIVKALRLSTLSKLTFSDRAAFEQIIADVFPGIKNEKVELFELRTAVSEVVKEMGLVELPHQVEKLLQMWGAINQRMGVCVVGPSGCGKTTLWTLLQKSLAKIGVKIEIEVMNPKSMPRQRLLGRVDYDTREWFDGVLTRAARRAVANTDRTWIVCDGDIDPEWIESLNSVLDDNRLLTLPNGERIQFDTSVNFVFETHSLEHASPATVSRMAVILLSVQDLTVQNVCQSWLSKWPKDSRVPFLMDQLFYRTVDTLISRSNLFLIQSTTFGIVKTILSHLDKISGNNDSEFVNALIRGAVAILPPSEQTVLANDIFKWSSQQGLSVIGLDSANILDQYWNGTNLQLFDFHPIPASLPQLGNLSLPLVATPEVQRTIHTVKPWIEKGEPVLLVGPRGSGKTTVLNHIFKMLTSTSIVVVNCSAKTDANSLMSKLMQQCQIASTATGQVLRPRATEKALVFFKNFDLPRPDKWGTVQLISFLQQLLTHGGFYNEELQWINIERIQFVFTMSSAEKRPISSRFTSIVRIASIHDTNQQQLVQIYSHYLTVILKDTPFKDAAKVTSIATSIVRVFQKFKSEFSADEYPHYDFTFRDITKWVIMLQRYIHNSNTFTPNIVIYEGLRHFVDRLANLQDRQRLAKDIRNIFHDNLSNFDDTDFEYTNYQIESNDKPPICLVQTERPIAQNAFRKLMVSYEREMGHLEIFSTNDTENLANRVISYLAVPCSNIVAMTTPGLSFVEILKTICHSSGVEIYSPPPLAEFSYQTFAAFLKDLIPKVSSKDEEVVMLVEDFMFVEDSILDALNSLMASGEVGGLFSQAEFDSLIASLQSEYRDAESDMTPQEFFCNKIKKLIHVVVVLNPQHSNFRSYFSFAPSFISDSMLIWSTELSKESLNSIPRQVLVNSNTDGIISSETITKITPMFVQLFESVSEPPIRYSQFLSIYEVLFLQKQKEMNERKKHLDIGLSKLNEAAKTVDTLSAEIGAKKENLKVKEKNAQEAMERIQKAVKECSAQQAKIETITKNLSEEEKKLQVEQSKIEKELSSIQPEIDEAIRLVGQIRRDQLAEVRGFAKPPPAIADVMQGVLLMLGEEDSTWPGIKKIIAQDGFTKRIITFDVNKMSKETITKVNKLITQKASSYDPDTIKKASQAVAPLAAWVKANIRYFSVLEKVDPLKQQMNEYSKQIQKKRGSLQKLQDEKKSVDKKVEEYQEQFRKSTKEAEQLKNEVKTAETNLSDAETLFSKLKDERTRWDAQRGDIVAALNKLPKDSLLAAAVAAFCGQLPEDERRKMLSQWYPIIGANANDSNFSLARFMYTENDLLELRGCLGGDSLSIENAVIIVNSNSVPLIIDPTATALDWLVKYYEKQGKQATVLPRGHERFSSELALAVRFGKILIISEIDSIDGILIPLIRKDFVYSGARPALKVGDREIDYNESFKLFLVTRDPSPQLHPTAASHVAIVNFSVTRSGLESMLLSLTLEKELPEIQQERTKLITEQEEMKLQLSKLEKDLLQALVASEGADILHNTALIESLNKTKQQSATVAEKIAKIESLSKNLEEKASAYKSLATLGASFYFSIAALHNLDHMYRYSSTLFLSLFSSIFSTQINASGEHRAIKFETELSRVVFRHVSTSMFNRHRAAAAIHIVKDCYSSIVNPKQFELLLSEAVGPSEAPKWVPADRKQYFSAFAAAMPDLVQTLKMKDQKYFNVWSDWINQPNCEENWPSIENTTITKRGVGPFTQLLLISVLAPHRLTSAIESFVKGTLQLDQFSVPFAFSSLLTSDSSVPTIFIVSAGADPSQEIEDICKKNKIKLIEIAVGQESIDETIAKLKKSAEEGSWFLIKNAHLSMTLVARVEKEFASLPSKKEGFKLLLTTEPHKSFPPLLLSNSNKVALEAPPGVRANLLRTLSSIDPKSISSKHQLKNIAAVSYFHSIIQERRVFIPQGWTKFYEFSTADLNCSLEIINRAKGEQNDQFEYIRGLLGIAIYGGRVDNDFDFQVLNLYLEAFLNEKANPLKMERNSSISDLLKHVNKMSERDSPTIFYLPPNATKTVALSNKAETISCLRRLEAIGSEGASLSRSQWVESLKPISERWKELNRKYPHMTETRMNSPADSENPIASALYSQYCIIHELVNELSLFFKDLDGFINHGEALSHELISKGQSLINNEVPDKWFDTAEGPEVATEWLSEVARKVDVIDSLAQDPQLMDKGIELSSLIRPTAIIDALRQKTAKKTGIPIVDLKLVFAVAEEHENAIYVKDIALQGAVMQGNKIAPMQKDDSIIIKCSTCSFSWEKVSESSKTVDIPLYSNEMRSKFIVKLPTACHGDPKVFAFAGAAFILNR
ncbi:Cytoplasmic dynein 2 heavy chain 1 [Tritrichomonas musculus]|uniref:Cytoplasmic dynein 2 heavy chain 1 n=1 Tax=Tritrichomonas musculus TaxID=1915356 RepID=A0ABR2JVL3_9EUKA